MRVLHCTTDIGCITFTSLYSLHQAGHQVDLLDLADSSTDTSGYYERLCAPYCQRIESIDAIESGQYRAVILEAVVGDVLPSIQKSISALAKHLTIIPPDLPNRIPTRIKNRLAFLKRNARLFYGRPHLATYDDLSQLDVARFFSRSKSTIPIDVHHKFLTDSELEEKIFGQDWTPNGAREILVNFIGAPNSDLRIQALSASRHVLAGNGISVDESTECVWIEVGPANPGLSAHEFCSVLANSHFTLCPGGTSPWSHRIVEALLRGSIPVIGSHAQAICDLPLENAVNCIVAEDDRWQDAIRRMLDSSEASRIEMRQNILALISEGHLRKGEVAMRTSRSLLGSNLDED